MKNQIFYVDEIVLLKSPYTDKPIKVNYRGKEGEKAVVWTGKSQIIIPIEWISKTK